MENSPLRRLPPELRNRIYELAFRHLSRPGACSCIEHISEINDITRTCREIRSETHAMLFASCVLLCDIGFVKPTQGANDRPDRVGKLSALLQLLGPSILSQLRSLRVQLAYWHSQNLHHHSLEIVGQGHFGVQVPFGGVSSFKEKNLPQLFKVRKKIFETLAGMGLCIEILDQGKDELLLRERWTITLPTAESPEATPEPT